MAAASKAAEGALTVDSKPGQGSTVTATFRHGHIDRAPLGDIETTLMILLIGHPDKDILFRHRIGDRLFELNSQDFRVADIDLASPMGLAVLREAIRKGESDIRTTL